MILLTEMPSWFIIVATIEYIMVWGLPILVIYKLIRILLLMISGKCQKGPVKELKLTKEQNELIKREMVIRNMKYNDLMNEIIAFYFKNN